MQCSKCDDKAIYMDPPLCKRHFIEYFEDKVKDTIQRFELIKKEDRILVATSGGKDSLTCLYLLNKLYPSVEALIVDEGISGYRANEIEELKKFCINEHIKLNIITFKEEIGYSLDDILQKIKVKPCTACGILRRYLLNRFAKDYDLIATGHNMDDESQAIMMNMLRNNISLLSRLGPISGVNKDHRFTPRIKPLYLCSEKETKIYSLLKGLKDTFSSCPHVTEAYRAKVRDFLNKEENHSSGTKKNIINWFLDMQEILKKKYSGQAVSSCSVCGGPSADKVCNACRLLSRISR